MDFCKSTMITVSLLSTCLVSLNAYSITQEQLYLEERVKVARNSLDYSLQKYSEETATVAMYSSEEMNSLVESNSHLSRIKDTDKCQFTPDIEALARKVGVSVFEFVWGDMLLTGTCVQQDVSLGLSYMQKSIDHAYAPAYERLARYYEKGYLVGKDVTKSEIYMKVAASLGSEAGRLGWADMLVRGYGSPSMYEQAYSWLYHSTYSTEYSRSKSEYLKTQLEQKMPANIIARAIAIPNQA